MQGCFSDYMICMCYPDVSGIDIFNGVGPRCRVPRFRARALGSAFGVFEFH